MFIASTVSSSVVERLGRLLITVCTGMSLVRIQPDPQHTDVFISTRSDATLITVLSLGAGVQSTTVALMAAVGEIKPMPDCAIFADTRWEPKAVYDHLDRLTAALPFPVHVVSAGNYECEGMCGV